MLLSIKDAYQNTGTVKSFIYFLYHQIPKGLAGINLAQQYKIVGKLNINHKEPLNKQYIKAVEKHNMIIYVYFNKYNL